KAEVWPEGAARVADLAHPAVAHLEAADLVSRAEAVLLAAQDAKAVVPLTLQVQHGVDDVLEHPRPGYRAFLVDVTDEKDRDVAALRQQHQSAGTFTDLAHAPWGGGDTAHEDGLDRVDDGHHRPGFLEMLDNAVQVVFGQHDQAFAVDTEALRTELELLDGLLAGHVEHRPVGARNLTGELEQQRRLANAGIATDQHQRAGHDAAAQYLVELPHGQLEPVGLGEADLRKRHRLRGRDRDSASAAPRRRLRPDLLLGVRVPVA